MAQLTFYGGIREIGGNKILLEDRERRLLLDFSFPYKRFKLFYEEYLQPRSGAGLLDPLVMGLLPPLEGLYRDDLSVPVSGRSFGKPRTIADLTAWMEYCFPALTLTIQVIFPF
jgi:ribonuclease J